MTTAPWYLDWTFWTMTVAALALVLSQLPPLNQLIKRSRLEVEPYNVISITHTIGNPNATLYLALHNVGGRDLKINSVDLQFTHADGDTFTIPGQGYYPTMESEKTVIMPPFRIKPNETWGHTIQFFRRFNREDDRTYRLLVSNLKADIAAKKSKPENRDVLVEAEQENVKPVFDFFNARYKWKAGEYSLLISVNALPASGSVTKSLRFTLFESDAHALKSYCDQYKIGLGVFYFDIEQQPGVFVPLVQSI